MMYGGRQNRGCIIPQAVTHSPVLLKMGKVIFPKHVELTGIINKPLLLHLVGLSILFISKMHGGPQHLGCIIPQPVTHSLVILKMGEIIARNMLS